MVPSNLTGMMRRQTEHAARMRVLSDCGPSSVSDWSTATGCSVVVVAGLSGPKIVFVSGEAFVSNDSFNSW